MTAIVNGINREEGAPRRQAEHGSDDVREWGMFKRPTLVGGELSLEGGPQNLGSGKDGAYSRPPSTFRNWITEPESGGDFEAEAGRYHLLVSGVCPWASGCRTMRCMLGLEDAISMDIADGQSSGGWCFLDGVSMPPFAGRAGPFYVHEAYAHSDPEASCRLTVPVLWDKKTEKIVNNESSDIMRMFGTVFRPFATKWYDFFPVQLESVQMPLHDHLNANLLNGVYRVGINTMFGKHEEAAKAKFDVFNCLDMIETRLGRQRYLAGNQVTWVDLRFMMNLLRFDLCYFHAFGCNQRKICSYPNISSYASDMYPQLLPEETCDWNAYFQYFRWGPAYPRDKPLPRISKEHLLLPKRTLITSNRGERRVLGMPVPPWFKDCASKAFRELELKPTDILLASGPKCGTHLLKLAILCLTKLGPEGETPEDSKWLERVTMYAETFPVELPPDPKPPWNNTTFSEIWLQQQDPRLFSSHSYPGILPESLSKSGKLVFVARNPKDSCTSLYYMFGVPADGWLGAFSRYYSDDCPNAFGSWFDYHRLVDHYVAKHMGGWGGGRAHLVYYEDMVNDKLAEVDRLASFLEIQLSEAKRTKTLEMLGFDAMKESKFGAGAMDKGFYRKGEVGDWKRHFLPEQNEIANTIFMERMNDVAMAKPYFSDGRLGFAMSGDGTSSPCWNEPDHEEQRKKSNM